MRKNLLFTKSFDLKNLIAGTAIVSLFFSGINSINAQLLSENFDSSMPAGWNITDGGSTTNTWYRTSGGFDVMNALGGGATFGSYITGSTEFIIVDSDVSSQTSNETITTPVINSAAYTSLTLAFDQVFDNLSPDNSQDFCYVEVFNGSTWVNVATFGTSRGTFLPAVSSQPISTNHQSINITAYANANMQIRFNYVNGNANAYWWGLDNIEVTGTIGASAPNPDFSASAVNGCVVSDTITLNDLSSNTPTGWNWSFSPSAGVSFVNGTSATSQNPDVVFAQSGNYAVKLVASNSTGSDSLTKSGYISIDALPTVSAGPDASVCGTSVINLAGSVGGSATGGYWESSAGTFGSNTVLTTTFTPNNDSVPGEILITLTTSGGQCAAIKDSLNVTYVASSTISLGADISTCSTDSIPLSANYSGATGIIWSGGNGSFTPADSSASVTYLTDAADITAGTIEIIGTTANGCPSNISDTLTITLLPQDSCSVGIAQRMDAGIGIFPNPANDFINIDLSNIKDQGYKFSFNLINAVGATVKTGILYSKLNGMDIGDLDKGLYYITIVSETDVVLTRRITIN